MTYNNQYYSMALRLSSFGAEESFPNCGKAPELTLIQPFPLSLRPACALFFYNIVAIYDNTLVFINIVGSRSSVPRQSCIFINIVGSTFIFGALCRG